jgi:hydroxyacylglutathione hydrolase
MKVLVQRGGVAMTNSILIADEAAKQAVLFDAPDHTIVPLLDAAARNEWQLTGLWLTHGHFDHFADHTVLRKRVPNARILIHALDEPKARHPEIQTAMFGLPFEIAPLKADGYVTDDQKLTVGSINVTVLHTPGHSPGSVVYYLPDEALLIGGDLIIGGSIGRTDLPDSDHRKIEASIRRVMALPPATRLLGGHGPATTLQQEGQDNPFVREILEGS